MYSFLRARVESHGRYGRTREIVLDMPDDVIAKIYEVILLNFQLRTAIPKRPNPMPGSAD